MQYGHIPKCDPAPVSGLPLLQSGTRLSCDFLATFLHYFLSICMFLPSNFRLEAMTSEVNRLPPSVQVGIGHQIAAHPNDFPVPGATDRYAADNSMMSSFPIVDRAAWVGVGDFRALPLILIPPTLRARLLHLHTNIDILVLERDPWLPVHLHSLHMDIRS
jgi:hypothetical protein